MENLKDLLTSIDVMKGQDGLFIFPGYLVYLKCKPKSVNPDGDGSGSKSHS